MNLRTIVTLLGISSLLLLGCTRQVIHRELKQVEQASTLLPSRDVPVLKLHCRDGSLYMLDQWNFPKEQRSVAGTGVRYDLNRDLSKSGSFQVPFDNIAIAEVNQLASVPAPTVGLAVMTTVTGIGAIICLTNPKACFGSCPTFYAWDGHDLSLMAEGFSASIAPCLAAGDVDALPRARLTGRSFGVLMKNEALETHVVQGVRMLVAPRPTGGRVFKTSEDRFYQTGSPIPPDSVLSEMGRVESLFCDVDGNEYFTSADSVSLATRETVDLYFKPGALHSPGLVIAYRQSLMTTFLLYQTLAYMGDNTGYWLAKLECSSAQLRSRVNGPGSLLGWIEVLVQDSRGEWKLAGEIGETGPIATDVSLVRFPEEARRDDGSYHVRIRMTKGYWRIDLAAMVDVFQEVTPVPLYAAVAPAPGTDGKQRSSEDTLWSEPIITIPGNVWLFEFTLPEHPEQYELFLESRGYYLEWLRDSWLAEENPDMVLLMMQDPEAYLEAMTPMFKSAEPSMEKTFWRSKYERVQ